MKNVVITGITGLVGTHLANALAGTEHRVFGLTRNPNNYSGRKAPNITLMAADLIDQDHLCLQDADAVVHLAAETATNLAADEHDRTNFHATVRLFERAKADGVKHFIFVSTANTVGYGTSTSPGTELREIKAPFAALGYAQSKLKAEDYLMAHSGGIKLTILNPTFIVGAHAGKPSSARIFLASLGKRLVWYPPGGKNFVAVGDVVRAILTALDQKHPDGRYLIAGENLSYYEFFQKLSRITGQRQRLFRVPPAVLSLLGLLGNALRALGINTDLSLHNMRALCAYPYYSNRKSVEHLGISYTDLNEALERAIHDMGYRTANPPNRDSFEGRTGPAN